MILDRFSKFCESRMDERARIWNELVDGDSFFRELRGAVQDQHDSKLSEFFKTAVKWRDWLYERDPADDVGQFVQLVVGAHRWSNLSSHERTTEIHRVQRQAGVLVGLVWCGRQAARNPDRFRGHVDRAEFEGIDLGVMDKVDRGHLWGWTRSLLVEPVAKPISVDIAIWGQSMNPQIQESEAEARTSEIVQLSLDILEGGINEVFLHPADAFCTQCDDVFNAAITTAWFTARARQADDNALRSGRYRILRGGKPIARIVSGGSAGGAAFRGWWHALQNKIPDPELFVLAAISKVDGQSSYELQHVDGLEAKVQAIVNLRQHDTIAVANSRDAMTVRDLLSKSQSFIKVVDLSQLS